MSGERKLSLEDRLRGKIRVKQLSLRTEEAYVGWYRRFVLWHGKRHPAEMGKVEVEAFLTDLAVVRKVGESTQNQALNAILFLYREVLEMELEGIDAVRASGVRKMPVVLTREEIARLLRSSEGAAGLLCRLMYGCGLRVAEGLALRVKDVDLEGGKLEVRSGKGNKDRVVPLPRSLLGALEEHRQRMEMRYEDDVRNGGPNVFLPKAYGVKNPGAANEWVWYWFFPGASMGRDPRGGRCGGIICMRSALRGSCGVAPSWDGWRSR